MSHDWREDEPIGEYVDKDGNDVQQTNNIKE